MTIPHPLPADRPVKVGVVGLGGAAQLIHLPLLEQLENVQLIGIADPEEYKLARVSERYNVPGWVDSTKLLDRGEPDLVLVCTPTISHLPVSLAALAAGAHVVVEKPVARTLEEARRLAEAARKHRREVLVAMNLRFRQDVGVLANFLRADELGEIWRVRSGWLKKFGAWHRSPWQDNPRISGGGVLMDLGIQLVDVVLALLDFPRPQRVAARTFRHNLRREVEDTVVASVHFAEGPLFNLECSWGALAPRDRVYTEVEGTVASAQLNPLVIHRTVEDELVTVTPVKTAQPQDLYTASFELQWHHFLGALRGEREIVCGIEEAVSVMELVDLVYRSAEENREIIVD